jgi:hypothetical protein
MNSNLPNGKRMFSRNPPISLDDIEMFLTQLPQNNEFAKKELIKFVKHRLHDRYIAPLLNTEASGFLMMAASCLLIETLQSFYDGLPSTKYISSTTFMRFFERQEQRFPYFRECFPLKEEINKKGEKCTVCSFYKHIRCGILHQAETTGGYRILRNNSPLFDSSEKSVNADAFLEAVRLCVDDYTQVLSDLDYKSKLWHHAAKKIRFICNNFHSHPIED